MMELSLFGLSVLLFYFTWRFMWRPAALDAARDKLFDLRDKTLRDFFVQHHIPLDHKIYRALRDLINGHLRHTESVSFIQFFLMAKWSAQNPEADMEICRAIERNFRTDDSDLKDLVDKVRATSALIMIEYMIRTSLAALMITYIVALLKILITLVKSIFKLMRGIDNAASVFQKNLSSVLASASNDVGWISSARAKVAMEEYALKQA